MQHSELSRPLNEKEQEQLLRLENLHESGAILSMAQGDALADLWQREYRPVALDLYRKQEEAYYFGEYGGDEVEVEHAKVYNYRAKVEAYNQHKKHRTFQQSLISLIEEERQEQAALKEQAKLNASNRSDRDQVRIRFDIIEQVYFEYEQFLARELEALKQAPASLNTTVIPAPKKLSLRQVALLHTYENKVIPKAADELARKYKHNSGANLYGHYLTVSQRAGRIGEEIVGQRLTPMIKDIKAVIPHLSETARKQAESELQTLEARK